MYRKTENQLPLEDFYLPFGGKLNRDNRWVILSQIIPWDTLEERYASRFAKSRMGAPAKPVRMALGALIIKEKCGFSDEETVEQIRENHYFQYFIGLSEYRDKIPFDPSMMVHFRKRLNAKVLNEVNELICDSTTKKKPDDKDKGSGNHFDKSNNHGHLILDATCAPADIRYPTDLLLLNEARKKLEDIINTLYEPLKDKVNRPRTYRINARKDYFKSSQGSKND